MCFFPLVMDLIWVCVLSADFVLTFKTMVSFFIASILHMFKCSVYIKERGME